MMQHTPIVNQTWLSASSFLKISVSAHPDINIEQFLISLPWKEFPKSSKMPLRVYKMPERLEKPCFNQYLWTGGEGLK